MATVQIQRVSHRHDRIIDWLLANPTEKNLQVLADEMNVSRSWLSVVMRSDAFQEEYHRRRGDLESELARDVVRTGFETALKANQRLGDYLDLDMELLDPRIILDSATGLADRLYGPKTRPGPELVSETVREVEVDQTGLQRARERIRKFNGKALPAPADTEYSDDGSSQ